MTDSELRLEAILKSNADYDIFVAKCNEFNITPMSILTYSSFVGTIPMAQNKYPNLPLLDAINTMSNYMHEIQQTTQSPVNPIPKSSTSCCGGGKIR